jgi:hypothetical protein
VRYQPYRRAPQAARGTLAERDRMLPLLELAERDRNGAMFLAAEPGDLLVEIHPIEGAHPDDRCWRVYLATLPLLDLYERYADNVKPFFLTGGVGGVRLFIYPIVQAAVWRLYVAPGMAGTQKDRARPTAVTRKPPPARWAAVQQGMTRQLAAIGMQAPFYGDQMQREFGFDPPAMEDKP